MSYRFSILTLVVCLAASAVWGQAGASNLRGQIKDPSGASIPGATVTATGPGGVVKVATADEQGSYAIGGLPPGSYTIKASAGGQTLTQTVTVGAPGLPEVDFRWGDTR